MFIPFKAQRHNHPVEKPLITQADNIQADHQATNYPANNIHATNLQAVSITLTASWHNFRVQRHNHRPITDVH